MEHLQDVTEARYFVEEVLKEIDTEETAAAMDPMMTQMNEDCLDEGIKEHPEYLHMNPDVLDDYKDDIPIKSIYRRIEIQPLEILKEKTRCLDKFQRHVVDIAIKFCRDIVKARNASSKVPSPPFLMVHGGAGAGKSTVINVMAQWVQLILQKEGDDTNFPCVLKVAPTGTAASNIEGQTLHTAFNFSYDGKIMSLSDKSRDQKREILKNLKMESIFKDFFFILFKSFKIKKNVKLKLF